MTGEVSGRAAARVGLLGNPSDGYGGRVIAMTLPEFEARVSIMAADQWDTSGSELFAATIEALRTRHPTLIDEPGRLSFTTSIPRQVGLAGSSALIMATLRALGDRADFTWDPVALARTTLEVETEVLGWTAGPQDRVVQAYEGLVDMDFTEPWQAERYQRLDAARLPPLFVAWNRATGQPSDVVHADVRARWLAGDEAVRRAMQRFAELAALGREALDADTAADTWPALLEEAFELRSRFWPITVVDTDLIEAGRRAGAGVAFAGSGGAVVGAVDDASRLETAAGEYADCGAGFVVVHR